MAQERRIQEFHYCPFIDVRSEWYCAWANCAIDQGIRLKLNEVFKEGLRPLIDLERATSARVLRDRDATSFPLLGSPGFEIEVRADAEPSSDGSTLVSVFVKNATSGVLAFVANPATEVILDGAVDSNRLLDQIGRPQLRAAHHRDPFIYVQPNERRQLGGIGLGRLERGSHTVRIVKHHFDQGWTDMRPTYHDGSPVYRRVMQAWIGVVVSNEITITIPPAPTALPPG